jgi:pyruvate dehydrogenase (quinone)/pyruvate oxidase
VAHITFPLDIQEREVKRRTASKRNVPDHTSDKGTSNARLPAESELKRAASILNRGKRIAILAGSGALHATDALEQVAEKLGAPIIKPLLGKAAVPDDSPYTTGGIGLLGTRPSQEALEDCDTLLMAGTSFPYIEYYPDPGAARAVQIDLDPARIGLRYPVDVGLVGDSRRCLEALLPMLERNNHRSFLKHAQKGMEEWWRTIEKQGTRQDMPMKPQVVAWELGNRLDPDAIVSTDSGTVTVWGARCIRVQRGQMFSCSGTLASMGCAVPYAIAAQLAYPGREPSRC